MLTLLVDIIVDDKFTFQFTIFIPFCFRDILKFDTIRM